MKMSIIKLKSIVKECLIEILQEGLGSSLVDVETTTYESRDSREPDRRRITENVAQKKPTQKRSVEKRPSLKEDLLNSIFPADPVMKSILTDTALTTLREQSEFDRSPTREAITDPSPDEVVDEQSKIWQQLAFSKK